MSRSEQVERVKELSRSYAEGMLNYQEYRSQRATAIDAAQFSDDDDTIRHKLKKNKIGESAGLTPAQIWGRALIGFAVFATALAGVLLYNL